MKATDWVDMVGKMVLGGLAGYALRVMVSALRRLERLEAAQHDLAAAFLTLIRNLRYGPAELLESEQEAWRIFEEALRPKKRDE